MRIPRFYCSPIKPGIIELNTNSSHHIADVYRLRRGNEIELFDGRGSLAQAVISSCQRNRVIAEVITITQQQPPARPTIIIASSLARTERFNWLVSKCTELGVDRIIPVIFQRTVKQPHNRNIVQRYEKLALAAAQQSQRAFLPRIDTPSTLTEVLAAIKQDYPHISLLTGSLDNTAPQISDIKLPLSKTDSAIAAFIGPEGGMTDKETALLKQHNAQPVQLTNTILRIETAAIAFAVFLCIQKD